MERETISCPSLSVNKTIIYQNCACMPVLRGHTRPLQHCIVPPLRVAHHYLRIAGQEDNVFREGLSVDVRGWLDWEVK